MTATKFGLTLSLGASSQRPPSYSGGAKLTSRHFMNDRDRDHDQEQTVKMATMETLSRGAPYARQLRCAAARPPVFAGHRPAPLPRWHAVKEFRTYQQLVICARKNWVISRDDLKKRILDPFPAVWVRWRAPPFATP